WFLTFFGEYRGARGASHGQEEHAGHGTHLGRDEAAPRDASLSSPKGVSAAHDQTPGHGHTGIHESPWVMLGPLVLLAVLSFAGGWIGWPAALGGANHFDKFLAPAFRTSTPAVNAEYARPEENAPSESTAKSEAQMEKTELVFAGISLAAALAGLFL